MSGHDMNLSRDFLIFVSFVFRMMTHCVHQGEYFKNNNEKNNKSTQNTNVISYRIFF